jgi:hypothetical protein
VGAFLAECDGITDGGLAIPQFGLAPGQAICLAVPYPVPEAFHTRLYQLLSGQRRVTSLRFSAPPVCVNLAGQSWPTLWTRLAQALLPAPRTVDWLRKHGKLTAEQAAVVLADLGWPVQTRMDRLPGTPRTLIRLEAAFGVGAKVIALSGMGLDPFGRDAVLRKAAALAEGRAIIHVVYPYWCQNKLYRDDVPDVPTIDLGWPGSQACTDRFPRTITNRAS